MNAGRHGAGREPKARYVVLMGPPGAGKGTQAERVAERLGLAHVSTGDLFREAMARQSELGRRVAGFVQRGEYVPDETTLELVRERLAAPDAAAGAVLDGFPRTLSQADGLGELLARRRAAVDRVVYLDVDEEVVVLRLSGRWTCRRCQAAYHTVLNPPQAPGVCDQCGGELYQREDDRAEVVRRRLEVYAQRTAPLVARYAEAGLLSRIDGDGSVPAVTERVLTALGQQAAGSALAARRSEGGGRSIGEKGASSWRST